VGGGEQAQRLGAALGVVGGALEAGPPLADPAGGHVLATGFDQLVRSHRAPPTCWPPRGPRVIAIVSERRAAAGGGQTGRGSCSARLWGHGRSQGAGDGERGEGERAEGSVGRRGLWTVEGRH